MGRSVYPYELDDPDFAWLISRFREDHPEYAMLDVSTLPLTMIKIPEILAASYIQALPLPAGFEDSLQDQEEGDRES
jgi:hypothetical protein